VEAIFIGQNLPGIRFSGKNEHWDFQKYGGEKPRQGAWKREEENVQRGLFLGKAKSDPRSRARKARKGVS